jgi:hypothetical protein
MAASNELTLQVEFLTARIKDEEFSQRKKKEAGNNSKDGVGSVDKICKPWRIFQICRIQA